MDFKIIKSIMRILLLLLLASFSFVGKLVSDSWIRINQLGYEPDAVKIAVLISEENLKIKSFEIVDAISDKVLYRSSKIERTGAWLRFKSTF